MRIRYTPRAQADLDEIFRYLDERSPAGARAVKLRIVRSIERLAHHPYMAAETDEPGVRELAIVRYPYKVYCMVEGDEVWVLHIRHTSRRPWTDETASE
jgi:addiction module RelE/StbE family toxin